MTIQNMLTLWDWPTALGLLVAGIAVGLVWPASTRLGTLFLRATLGTAFFVFLFTFRGLTGVPNFERVLTTGLQYNLFMIALTIGTETQYRVRLRR